MTKIEELRIERKKRLELLTKKELIERIMDATLFTGVIILTEETLAHAFDVFGLLATIKSTHEALDN